MQLKDFDFRIWDTENRKYVNENYAKNYHCVGIAKWFENFLGETQDFNKNEFFGFQFFNRDKGDCGGFNTTENAEIELWTGIRDKNGKKIYEGDIVCFKNRGKYNDDRDEVLAKHIKEKCLKKTFLTQIFFKNEGGGYCIKRQTKRGHTKYFSLFDMSFYLNFRLEVVGNIHENADLLKKDKECN